jgi:demethoxyubiquinone hydroxylase (CLK1/Coq7/Cat5 family)
MADDHRPIAWLRRAHAGELGAALAYRGHARSLRPGGERARVWAILVEEMAHRREAAALLARRGARPDRRLVRRIARLGRIAGIACHLTGHLLPMLGAAVAEAVNVWEYRQMALAAVADREVAAFARTAGARESEHADWFLAACRRHHGWTGRALAAVTARMLGVDAASAPPRRSALDPAGAGGQALALAGLPGLGPAGDLDDAPQRQSAAHRRQAEAAAGAA